MHAIFRTGIFRFSSRALLDFFVSPHCYNEADKVTQFSSNSWKQHPVAGRIYSPNNPSIITRCTRQFVNAPKFTTSHYCSTYRLL